MSANNYTELLSIPKWINDDFMRPIIEKNVKDFGSIKNFATTAATQPGENYASNMVRVTVDIELKDGTEQQISYILKTMLTGQKGGTSLFPKEKQMYKMHIPNFIKLYKEAGADIELTPKCIHIEEGPEGITLVLEDLKCQHFHNIDRLNGLDMPHMHRVLHKLAEFHAASAVNHEINGAYEEVYQQTFYVENNRQLYERFAKPRLEQYFKAMRNWELPNVEKYIDISPSTSEFFDNAVALNKVDENDFNCLNHGDLWCNNIMFSDEASAERTLFVDLQAGKWGSPAQDLWYLITTSSSLDIKIKEFDHFIKIYHERLAECLKILKYSKHIPTLRELHIMMIKYGNWGPMTANSTLVAVLLPPDKHSNLNMLMAMGPEGDAARYKSFINPYYAKAMIQLYPFFENKGLLKKY